MNEPTRRRTTHVKKTPQKANPGMAGKFGATGTPKHPNKLPRRVEGYVLNHDDFHLQKTKSPLYTLISVDALSAKPRLPYREIFHSSLGTRAVIVKAGINPSVVRHLARDMQYDQGALVNLLGFARATYNRKVKTRKPLDLASSERVIGVMRLVGQVKQMVEESGDATDFDASAWVGNWLEQPLGALGGKAPRDYMDSAPGQELVSQLLAQAQSGAYA
jgi:putative toxin-antitoxin system antitoxin component (TIGR02293 family)